MADFVMPVENVFEIPGRGTVAVGVVEAGEVLTGGLVLVGDRRVRCEGIERFRELLPAARAGDAVGILLGDVSPAEVAGHVLRSP